MPDGSTAGASAPACAQVAPSEVQPRGAEAQRGFAIVARRERRHLRRRRRAHGIDGGARALPGRVSWARPLKRVFDVDVQRCPDCGGGEFNIIAAILERPAIEKILTHLGLDPQPPPRGRPHGAGQD